MVCGPLLLVGQHKFEKIRRSNQWRGKTFLFLFLPILGLGPLKGFLSCHGALQKPSTLKRRSLGTKKVQEDYVLRTTGAEVPGNRQEQVMQTTIVGF